MSDCDERIKKIIMEKCNGDEVDSCRTDFYIAMLGWYERWFCDKVSDQETIDFLNSLENTEYEYKIFVCALVNNMKHGGMKKWKKS